MNRYTEPLDSADSTYTVNAEAAAASLHNLNINPHNTITSNFDINLTNNTLNNNIPLLTSLPLSVELGINDKIDRQLASHIERNININKQSVSTKRTKLYSRKITIGARNIDCITSKLALASKCWARYQHRKLKISKRVDT